MVTGTPQITVTLFLRALGPMPRLSRLGVVLTPAGSSQDPDWPGSLPGVTGREWTEGNIVEWRGSPLRPAGMPAGEYRLRVALLSETGQVVAEIPVSEKDPAIVVTGVE